MTIKMIKKLSVRQMLQTTSIIRHAISFPRNIIVPGNVSVMALVQRKETKQSRCTANSGGGTLPSPKNGGRIVAVGFNSTLPYIVRLCDSFKM